MKKSKRNYLKILLISALFAYQPLWAQTPAKTELAINQSNYSTAIGLRSGHTGGLTIKQFVSGNTSLEGIIGVWNRGLSATLLYEKNVPAFNVAGLNWYYGAGGHASFSTRYWDSPYERRKRYYYDNNFGLGIDGILGIEYKIPPIPFAISIDAIPFIEVVSNGHVWGSIDPGVGIKLVF